MPALVSGAEEFRDVLEVWLPLLVCMALGSAWYHVLRLRERAIGHARRTCEQHGLQLLDDSVALHRVHARWRDGGLQLTREYRFDTSVGGHDRQAASISLRRDRIVGASLPQRDAFADAPPAVGVSYAPQTVAEAGGRVVPITRARRTLH